jgi:hypothetical protein
MKAQSPVSVTEWERFVSKLSDLVQGTLDLLILKILALEPQHGLRWAASSSGKKSAATRAALA